MATVDLKCAPDLPHVASHARNAEYNPRRFSAAIMRLREPAKATGLLFGTGKLCLTGVKSEDDARHAARKIAKIVQKLGFNAGFADFKIQNMVATGDVGFPVRLEGIADTHRKFSSVSEAMLAGSPAATARCGNDGRRRNHQAAASAASTLAFSSSALSPRPSLVAHFSIVSCPCLPLSSCSTSQSCSLGLSTASRPCASSFSSSCRARSASRAPSRDPSCCRRWSGCTRCSSSSARALQSA